MFKLFKQLLIEFILTGAKPYIASHPELGVPIGIFNYKDEPNREARIKSIKKLGKKGNPHSSKLAKLLGVDQPIPSYADIMVDEAEYKQLKADVKRLTKAVRGMGTSSIEEDRREYEGTNQLFKFLQQASQVRTPRSGLSVGDLGAMKDAMTDILDGSLDIEKSTGAILDGLALEDTLRLDISKSLGLSNAQLYDQIEILNESAVEMSKFAITANDLYETFKKMTSEIGRNLFIPPEVTERASLLTKTLAGFDAGKFAKAFDTIGYSLGDAMGEIDSTNNAMSDILETGRAFGVVMEEFLGTIGDNLNLINTFGFEKGTEGLARMVARGQALGLSMDKVTSLADKFFDPEGAIDFAAQMNVIGGAVGDLADPFKLMYMATNDLEGLQTAIVDTAAAAVHFDKEKGKFSISPDQRRQLRAMAEQMGMSYQELADTAIKSARRAEVFNKMEFTGYSDTDKELIAGMAEIGKGGVAQVRIPGLDAMVDVEDLTAGQVEELKKSSMKDSDIYKQQLTVAEAANQYLAAMDAGIRILVRDLGKAGAEGQIDQMALSQQLAGQVPQLTDEQRDIMTSGDKEEIMKMISELSTAATGSIDTALADMLKNAAGLNDFIVTPDGIHKYAKGDLVTGVDLPSLKAAESKNNTDIIERVTSMNESINNVTNNNMAGGNGMVQLTGSITLKSDNPNDGTAKVKITDLIKNANANELQAFSDILKKAING